MARYDAKTALVVVDVQNDFASPDGSLFVSGGDAVIPRINEEVQAAREAGALVVYTRDWHPPSTPHFEKDGGIWPVHCVRDTPGAAFHPDLDVVDAPIVHKGTGGEDGYSAFTVRDPETGETDRTDLVDVLREHGIERVVVAGLALDYCVKETVLDAKDLGFESVVLSDCTAAVNREPGDDERAWGAIREAGAVVE